MQYIRDPGVHSLLVDGERDSAKDQPADAHPKYSKIIIIINISQTSQRPCYVIVVREITELCSQFYPYFH